jgi:Ran GTPase-activating protein (RanGAP) involved in mRNA processing and transport
MTMHACLIHMATSPCLSANSIHHVKFTFVLRFSIQYPPQINPTMHTLNLAHNKCGPAGAAALSQALRLSTQLFDLDMSDNRLGAAGTMSICDALRSEACALRRLCIDTNGMGDEGAVHIAAALRANTTLERIELGFNWIGAAGMRALCDVLCAANATLTHLIFGQNDAGDAGAAALADMLRVNASVAFVDLRSNGVGDIGAASIGGALRANACLTRLDLRGNRIGAEGCVALAAALVDANGSLQRLNLENNAIGGDGAHALSDALRGAASSLCELNLNGNRIGAAGGVALAGALATNTSLVRLRYAASMMGHQPLRVPAFAIAIEFSIRNLINVWVDYWRQSFIIFMKMEAYSQ